MIWFNTNATFKAEFTSDTSLVSAAFSSPDQFNSVMENITKVSTGNYEDLANKPQINGVSLTGNQSSQDLYLVSENTTAGWNSNPMYLPKKGEICVYTDYTTVTDDQGRTITYPEIKIGDGNSYLIDLPLASASARYFLMNKLQEHIDDTSVHIQPGERQFWNNKLNYDVSGEDLILTRN